MTRMPKIKKIIKFAANFSLLLGFINGLIFGVIGVFIGGMAFNGGHYGSRYFLGDSGELTEVTAGIYMYSFWHGVSVISLIAIAISLAALDQFVSRKRGKSARLAGKKLSIYDYAVLALSILFAAAILAMMIFAPIFSK